MTTLIGIDPGLAATGWGVVGFDGNRFRHVAHGVLSTGPDLGLPERLRIIYEGILAVLDEHRPDEAGVEELYFARNVGSAIPVAHARGVVVLALGQRRIPTGFYQPQQVKQAVIGKGRAEKGQVQRLVAVLLGLSEIPSPDHAADALAVAVCHCQRARLDVQQPVR
jgi:crossover junction endodeoxyribonuclease RuvC